MSATTPAGTADGDAGGRREPSGGGGGRASPVPDWVPDDLPAAPGVYRFEDPHGTLLYVGKSVNLKRRVRGWFYGGGPDDERLAEMLSLARRVRVTRTGTDLEAKLEEARRIVRDRPKFNRALKNRAHGWYLEVDLGVPYPRLRVTRTARKPRARYFGPFRGRKLPSEIAELARKVFMLRSCKGRLRPHADGSACLQRGIGLCTAPCVGDAGLNAYRSQVRKAVRALEDRDYVGQIRAKLAADRDRLADDWRFEEAADRQRRIEWLDELEERRRFLERPALDRSWLLVLPAARSGRRVLVPVARGRVLERREAAWAEPEWRRAVRDACYAIRVAELRVEPAFPPEEMAPALIVTRWLAEGAEEGTALDLDELDAGGAVARLEAARAA